MKGLIFLTLALILVTFTKGDEDTVPDPAPAEVAEAKGTDPSVAAVLDQPGDPKIPEEETHLTPSEVIEAHDPAEVAKVEAEDKKDDTEEKKLAAEEKAEFAVEKQDKEEAKKEAADTKMPNAEKAKHKKIRDGHHKNYRQHHGDRVRAMKKRIISRIGRHRKYHKHG